MRMIVPGLAYAHHPARIIAVAARADAAADDDRHGFAAIVVAQAEQQGDRGTVQIVQMLSAIAKLRRPVGARPPRRAFKDEADARAAGEIEIATIICFEGASACLAVEQDDRREMRQVDAAVEDEVGLEPGVGQEQAFELAKRCAAHWEPSTDFRTSLVGPRPRML